MMGETTDDMRQKIEEMENAPNKKMVDVNQLKQKRKQAMESYI
jgi:hypothetical protein